jgi:hypothetical protein
MLVPGMSLIEIRKSIMYDYTNDLNQKLRSLEIMYMAKWIRNGRKHFTETITFTAKSRNSWHITIIGTKRDMATVPYLVWYDQIGITACSIAENYDDTPLLFFNTHFFKRYKERGKVNIEKPEDVVKFFFKNTPLFLPYRMPRKNGPSQLFLPVEGGIGLGNYPETNICEFKTFVDNSLLHPDQLADIQKIYRVTAKQVRAEIWRRSGRNRNESIRR